jgi:predicted O-linked N-acetylglucosamine transferase (SPINDLY family)
MRLLNGVENSVLWLTESNPVVARNLRAEAKNRHVAPERLVFAPPIQYSDYLARYRVADLFLDTLPFNGGATASDALWAGLPVVTCSGQPFTARMAGSLLKAVGLPELITKSLDEYEALALKLARNPVLLASIKQKLAHNRNSYPLFDTARFTRHIESAYTTMWKRSQTGEPPVSFSVDAIRN